MERLARVLGRGGAGSSVGAVSSTLTPWFRDGVDQEFAAAHYPLLRQHLPVRLLTTDRFCAALAAVETVERPGSDTPRRETFEALVGVSHVPPHELLDAVTHQVA